jgi:hydroxysqualene synthase
MITATKARSGKSHRDENFPVASWLVQPCHRRPILAFYQFARTADDVADHPSLTPDEKLVLLDHLEAALMGRGSGDPAAEPLRLALAERGLPARHALDLLEAFRLDARKARYADWSELIGYCALSAMPVGRFVLEVHGQDSAATRPLSDAICAALQLINHLQDCGRDFRTLDRVYLPLDRLAAHGAAVAMLGGERASPSLRSCLAELAEKTAGLLREGGSLPYLVTDTRLALEIAAIHRLATTLAERLKHRDPLSEPVHLRKRAFAPTALAGAASCLVRRTFRRGRLHLPSGRPA